MNLSRLLSPILCSLSLSAQASDLADLKFVLATVTKFKSDHSKLVDPKGNPCELVIESKVVANNQLVVSAKLVSLSSSITAPVTDLVFEAGAKADLYQSLTITHRWPLMATVENAESDGHGYWQTDRLQLGVYKSSITISRYDYQTKSQVNAACYGETTDL